MKRAALTLVFLLAGLFALAGSASGHAVLEESSPARGAVLEAAPEHVSFSFNEPVEASLGAVRVFNTAGEEVQTGGLERPGATANEVGAELPAELGDGLYTATYHVVSADSHPVSGGITFTVGDPSGGAAGFEQGKTMSELLSENETGTVTEVAFWADRWVGYLAIALALGALVWMLAVWGRVSGPDPDDSHLLRRFRRLVLGAAAAGLVASLLAIVFQGAVGAGTSFWGAFGDGIPGEVIETRFGTVMLIRAAAWIVLGGLVAFGAARFQRPGPVPVAALPVAAVLAVTPALGGHAATRDPGWLMIPSDIVHVAAMAVWAGGLAAMVWLLPAGTRALRGLSDRTGLLTRATRRFSTVALISVTLIAVSGAILAVLDVGSFPDLVGTQFGRAVLIKIVLFAILIALGAANRQRIIPAIARRLERSESPGPPGRRLRDVLRIETLLVIVVLGVTAALVSYPPPDSIGMGPASGSVVVEGNLVEYTVDPAEVGSNEMHIYIFDDRTGAPVPVRSMDVAFTLPDREIAPIDADVRRVGPGHYVILSAMLGVKGDWVAEAAMRLSPFEQPVAELEFEVE